MLIEIYRVIKLRRYKDDLSMDLSSCTTCCSPIIASRHCRRMPFRAYPSCSCCEYTK